MNFSKQETIEGNFGLILSNIRDVLREALHIGGNELNEEVERIRDMLKETSVDYWPNIFVDDPFYWHHVALKYYFTEISEDKVYLFPRRRLIIKQLLRAKIDVLEAGRQAEGIKNLFKRLRSENWFYICNHFSYDIQEITNFLIDPPNLEDREIPGIGIVLWLEP